MAARGFPGHPYDSDTLHKPLKQVHILSKPHPVTPSLIWATEDEKYQAPSAAQRLNLGLKGMGLSQAQASHQAIEPIIGRPR